MELLWSQSATANASFSTQSISIPKMADYKNILIKCVLSTRGDNITNYIYGGDAKTGTTKQFSYWFNSSVTRYRNYVVGNTSISFADAFYNSTEENWYFYPIAIYGYNE